MRYFAMLLAALTALVSFTSTASAREVFHGYVTDEYYLARGGMPATLEEIAANPRKIFRSEVAFSNFRAHLGSYLGYELTEQGFRELMVSDRVNLVPCFGTVDTSGVTDSGRFDWKTRSCYDDEMLIELTLENGSRVIVASQACYNPIRGRVPTPPVQVREYIMPPPPAVPDTQSYAAQDPTVSEIDIDLPSMGATVIVLDVLHRHNADCPPDHK